MQLSEVTLFFVGFVDFVGGLQLVGSLELEFFEDCLGRLWDFFKIFGWIFFLAGP